MISLYKKRNKKLLWINNFKLLLIPDSLKRLSAQNELKDYRVMLSMSDPKFWELHEQLEKIRLEIKDKYRSYDYGNGYYYQSMKTINISGYRNTEERIQRLNLENRVNGKTVLDIGTNAGFILLSLSKEISSGVGVEFNPYLVKTGKAVQRYLGVDNIEFVSNSFEDYQPLGQLFDVILSLANHSTYDNNTRQSLDDYFKKSSSLLQKNGELIFESHPPQIEPKEKLEETLSAIGKYFIIEEKTTFNMKGFLDKNRTYVFAKKK